MTTYIEFTEQIFEALLRLRKSPKRYAKAVLKTLDSYKPDNLYYRHGFVPVRINESRKTVEALIAELKEIKSLPKIERMQGLSNAALHIAYLLAQGVLLEEAAPSNIIAQYGYWYGGTAILVDQGSVMGAEALQALLVDDGVEARSNRAVLLNQEMRQVGIGVVPSKDNEPVAVLVFASNFVDKKEMNQIQPPEKEIRRIEEFEEWREGALSVECEINREIVQEKTTTRIKQVWKMNDSSIVVSERVI